MHAVIRYHVPSLFSARALASNAFSARTLLCPTPAMVKMGLLATLLRRDGAAQAQHHLDWLAPVKVAWAPAPVMAVSAATIRVWKEETKNDKDRISLSPLKLSVGLREYVHMEESFGIALLDLPEEHRDDLAYGLTHLRALGNAESMVQPLGPVEWLDELPAGFVGLSAPEEMAGEIAAVLDDLGSAPRFERLSVYRPNGGAAVPRLGDDRVRVLLRLPLRVRRRLADSYIVERL